jgi:hypothetical protein
MHDITTISTKNASIWTSIPLSFCIEMIIVIFIRRKEKNGKKKGRERKIIHEPTSHMQQ